MKEKSMAHLLPRKIKKACKSVIYARPKKSKRVRYVSGIVLRIDYETDSMGNIIWVNYNSKHGESISGAVFDFIDKQ
mgnify:CR=1 FL=1